VRPIRYSPARVQEPNFKAFYSWAALGVTVDMYTRCRNRSNVTHNLPYSQLNRLRYQQIQNCLARAVLKPPSSLTPLLFLNLYTGSKSISVLSIRFFLSHKVLTTAQPGYLRNLISVDSPDIETRSSVTLSRPSSSSSLKITDRSFRYASPCLWNQLPASFRQHNPDHSFSHSSQPNCLSSSVPSSPLSLSITPTLFHSKLKVQPDLPDIESAYFCDLFKNIRKSMIIKF